MKFQTLLAALIFAGSLGTASANTPIVDWECIGGDTSTTVRVFNMGTGRSQLGNGTKVEYVKVTVSPDDSNGVLPDEQYLGEVFNTKNDVEIIAQKNQQAVEYIGGVVPNSVFLKINGDHSVFTIDGGLELKRCSKPKP